MSTEQPAELARQVIAERFPTAAQVRHEARQQPRDHARLIHCVLCPWTGPTRCPEH